MTLYRPFADLLSPAILSGPQGEAERLHQFVERLRSLTSEEWRKVADCCAKPDFAGLADCAVARMAGIALAVRDRISTDDFTTACGPLAPFVAAER